MKQQTIIYKERVRAGMTQKELAKAVGVSTKTIRRYEHGIHEIPASILKRIAIVLNVSTDYLLGMKENNNKQTEERREAND